MKNTLAAALIVALLASPAALAITDEEGMSVARFDFPNPGVRNLAMGGAFLALANHASAAHTNPAGLAQLKHREFTAEYRHNAYTSPHLAGGGVTGPSDTLYGIARSGTAGPAFLSAAFPLGRASLALYRHEADDFRSRFAYAPEEVVALLPFEGRARLAGTVHGVWRGHAFDRFSLDAAADLSRHTDTYSISGAIRLRPTGSARPRRTPSNAPFL